MKKLSVTLILFLLLFNLTGCTQKIEEKWNQEKENIVYVTAITKEILPLTNAYLDLHTIYTDPLVYSLNERVSKFKEDKKTIEEQYTGIQKLHVPPEFTDVHQVLLSSLKTTIEVNNEVEKTVVAGKGVSQEAISTLDSSTQQLKEFSSSWERLKGLPEHQ